MTITYKEAKERFNESKLDSDFLLGVILAFMEDKGILQEFMDNLPGFEEFISILKDEQKNGD